MAIQEVESGQVKSPFSGWTKEQTEDFFNVEGCPICGENLWRDDFVYWAGYKLLAFHPDCARSMCHGLMIDLVKIKE